jgi:hypothetical protein
MRYDTVTIQQQPPVVEKDNQVRSSLSDKFRSARLIGAAVTTILLFPAIAVLILTKANWVAIGWTIFGCFAIGLTVGGYLTIKWAYEHAVRP